MYYVYTNDASYVSVMDASKLLEILDHLDAGDHNKPVSIDDLYGKVFESLPDDCSTVGGCLSCVTSLLEGHKKAARRFGLQSSLQSC